MYFIIQSLIYNFADSSLLRKVLLIFPILKQNCSVHVSKILAHRTCLYFSRHNFSCYRLWLLLLATSIYLYQNLLLTTFIWFIYTNDTPLYQNLNFNDILKTMLFLYSKIYVEIINNI